MIAIVDYGVGNLFSLQASLYYIGAENTVTNNIDDIRKADRIILPGVGAFCDAREKLKNSGCEDVILSEVASGKPLLGICLGMQMLFDKSHEFGEYEGLGLIGGAVVPLADEIKHLKIPHMGWNALQFKKNSKLFKYINDGDYVYYVHSYYANCDEKATSAVSQYGIDVTGAVECNNIYGTQFHPEKSGETGLKILKAFAEI